MEGFAQLIPGIYKSWKTSTIIGIEKVHFKKDYIYGCILDRVRQPILCVFALSSLPGHKIYKKPRIKLFKKRNKPALYHMSYYSEDVDHKPVDFNWESLRVTCQLNKK